MLGCVLNGLQAWHALHGLIRHERSLFWRPCSQHSWNQIEGQFGGSADRIHGVELGQPAVSTVDLAKRVKLGSIHLYCDIALTRSSGGTDTFKGAELCDGCLCVRQEAEGLSGTVLHRVLAVGSHQLLQSRPELPSLQIQTSDDNQAHSRLNRNI